MKSLLLLAIGLATVAVAADVWKKDFEQWSPDDAERILHDSPWAKETLATFDAQLRKHQGGAPITVGDPVAGGPSGGGRSPGGMGGPLDASANAGAMLPTMNLVVRWESSLPVKEALLRLKFGNHLPPESDPSYNLNKTEDHYVIAVVGLELPKKKKKPGEEDSAQDRMHDEFLATAHLIRRGRDAILASEVKVNPPQATDEVLFFFSRINPISVDQKEVIFETEQGAFSIRRAFHLKDMVYRGKLEL